MELIGQAISSLAGYSQMICDEFAAAQRYMADMDSLDEQESKVISDTLAAGIVQWQFLRKPLELMELQIKYETGSYGVNSDKELEF